MIDEIKNQQNQNMIEASHPLFQLVHPNHNNNFSEMSGLELQELLYYLDHYYLELRNHLGFDESITFGLELEFEHVKRKQLKMNLSKLEQRQQWELKHDFALEDGEEIVSPILKDTPTTWNDLKQVCSMISGSAVINQKSGGHIHIGTQVLGNQTSAWLNFMKLWSVYENVIYRFTYGEYLCERFGINRYAIPVTKSFWQDYLAFVSQESLNLDSMLGRISRVRNQAVNFNNVKDFDEMKPRNTIEFRCPNGTLEPVIWQNNVNLFVHLLEYSKSSNYDHELIQKRRILNEDKYASLEWYREIYLQQALELCDMIFTNNLDKIYFLRQYLKSFEIGNQELEHAKIFVKK